MQSVPTVAAFWQGQIADLFQGALPESEVKRFVEGLLKLAGGSMPGADLLAEAKAALEAGDAQQAGELFSALLQEEPENGDAWGGLIRALMALGQEDQARRRSAQVPAKLADHAEIAGARSALALAEEGREAKGQLQSLQARRGRRPDGPAGALRSRDRAERDRRARAGGRCAAGDHPAQPRLERRCRAAAAAEVLRGLGLRRSRDRRRAPQAVRPCCSADGRASTRRLEDLPAEFPVFPLPGALLLPRGKLPLNIFEPRYLAMTEDCARPRAHVRHDPAGPDRAGHRDRPGPVPRRLPGAAVLVQRDRRWPLPDHADRRDPLRHRRRDRDAPRLPARARRLHPLLADLDLAPQPIGVPRETLLAALRGYFAHRGFDANWDAIKRLPDDMLVVTLAMVCPFEPAEKQALLEAPTDAERAAALLALLQMGALAPGRPGGRSVS